MNRQDIAAANDHAVEQMNLANPELTGVQPAGSIISGMTKSTILHAGPPIEWDRMCGPMKAAIAGALILEGQADAQEEAFMLAASGSIAFRPCHDVGAVGPMAGVISHSMPVFVVRDSVSGSLTFSNLSEGRGRVLRYGGLGEEVMRRLRWMSEELGPGLDRALRYQGPTSVRSVLAEALHMGDDCHNRYKAASALFVERLAGAVAKTSDGATAERILQFLAGNDYAFLNPGMAGQKAIADSADSIDGCSIVTAMARNGTDFGIRVSGIGSNWYTAPAPLVDALYLPPYGPNDANPDLGDSAIAETTGFGGFAAAAAPTVAQFVGGDVEATLDRTREMYEIAAGESTSFTIPALGFRGVPTGIDVIKVVESNVLPVLHTGVAHREPGVGQVGAGIVRAPRECFVSAFRAFAVRYFQ